MRTINSNDSLATQVHAEISATIAASGHINEICGTEKMVEGECLYRTRCSIGKIERFYECEWSIRDCLHLVMISRVRIRTIIEYKE